jgi:hypothetical protein
MGELLRRYDEDGPFDRLVDRRWIVAGGFLDRYGNRHIFGYRDRVG